MTTFTTLELKKIMLSIADEGGVELAGDFLNASFPDLGFDSLAVLEIVTHVQQDYHLAIPDDAVDELTTPQDVVDYVTRQLRESV